MSRLVMDSVATATVQWTTVPILIVRPVAMRGAVTEPERASRAAEPIAPTVAVALSRREFELIETGAMTEAIRQREGISMDDGPLFRDRLDAGTQLAEALDQYRGKDVLVLGIPRGGVPVAAEIARRLDAELDVVVARKLGAPYQPELAVGAVTANGGCFLNEEIVRDLGLSDVYLERVKREQMAEARRREQRFRGTRRRSRIEGRPVIVVDDGLATGATMRAAIRSVRRAGPARLLAAVPVGSQAACAALRAEVDELVCLSEPASFWAVGSYYQHFEATEDAEVERILREARARRRPVKQQAGEAPGRTA